MARHMLHRIRKALEEGTFKLTGEVDVDATYVGGKERNKHKAKRTGNRGTQDKATVVEAKRRDGKIVARPLGWEPDETLAGFVRETVEEGKTVYTDEHQAYKGLKWHYPHETVKHSEEEYLRDGVHTNTIEAFWSMFKRASRERTTI